LKYFIKFFVCGVASAFLFPPFFLLPLGFIIFPYIFLLIQNHNFHKKKRIKHFFYGTVYGLGLNIVLLIWIKEPFLITEETKNISFLGYFLILYVSIFFGFSFVILSLFKNNISKLIIFPVVFVAMEIFREMFSFGFPWVTFALIFSKNYILLNFSYFLGTYGLSYFILIIFLIPVPIFLIIKNTKNITAKFYLFFVLILIIIMTLFLYLRLHNMNNNNLQNIKLSLNQLNINQIDKLNNLKYQERYEKIAEIIRSNKSDIIIFSENEYPFILDQNNIANLKRHINKNQSLIIGAIRKEQNRYYNSLFLINKNEYTFFDKKILVPFGEFLPFRKYLSFLNPIAGTIDFSKGHSKRLIKIDKNISFIPAICYEIIFFNNLIHKYNNNVSLMINITNDAWFGKFSGPKQHFYLSRIRSTEFNKYLIRVSNNGISSVINNYGIILTETSLNKEEQINIDFNIPTSTDNLINYHKLIYLLLIFLSIISYYINKKND